MPEAEIKYRMKQNFNLNFSWLDNDRISNNVFDDFNSDDSDNNPKRISYCTFK